jgi:solute carrier family 15 oligopeptide transporter 1
LRYPISILFIIGNEFCERFSFYGMKAILSIYLKKKLHFPEDTATVSRSDLNFFK